VILLPESNFLFVFSIVVANKILLHLLRTFEVLEDFVFDDLISLGEILDHEFAFEDYLLESIALK